MERTWPPPLGVDHKRTRVEFIKQFKKTEIHTSFSCYDDLERKQHTVTGPVFSPTTPTPTCLTPLQTGPRKPVSSLSKISQQTKLLVVFKNATRYKSIHSSSVSTKQHTNLADFLISPFDFSFAMVRTTFLAFSVVIFVLFVSGFAAKGGPATGGRTKVGDVNTNKEIQELGRYSVEEYNRSHGSHKGGVGDLKFVKVVQAEKQVVSGIKYYLKIVAFSKTGVSKVFDAEVVVKAWEKSKQLLTFKPSPAE